MYPVCIHAGAFAEHLPQRDLWVSPGHSIAIDGTLIQACNLVNGATIEQVACDTIEYWHVELDQHDVIFAEGLSSETYVDTGNRSAFINGAAFLDAFPDFKPKHWAQTCLPLVLEGEAIHRVKGVLLERAMSLGYSFSEDSQLHLVADGGRIEPIWLNGSRAAFVLPASAERIELACRGFIPARVIAASDDQRELGICVARLQLDGETLSLDDDRLAGGWHAVERNPGGEIWRWTAPRAHLPSGARLVMLDSVFRGLYWQKTRTALARCA